MSNHPHSRPLNPADPQPAPHGYLLAGGQSSRMGSDKALLPFRGATLLERALATLRLCTQDVTIVGRSYPLALIRFIPDHVTQTGPVAGVEAALTDLASRQGTWALFLPVDVPLLPSDLLRALVDLWLASPDTRIAFPIADSIPQPVISLVHVDALPTFREALAQNQRRLRPTLEQAATHLASELHLPLTSVLRTPVLTMENNRVLAEDHPLDWQPSPEQRRTFPLWFSNANTPAELDLLRTTLL